MKHLLKLVILLSLTLVLFSCDKEEDVNLVDLTGKITNTTDTAVGNATIQLLIDGEAKYTTTSSSTGEYDFSQIKEGNYTITVNYQGYNEFSTTANLVNTSNKDFVLVGSANVTGLIINSQTGQGLADATVSFFEASKETNTANASLIISTDSTGYFTISNGPIGDFTGMIEAIGFFVRIIEMTSFTTGDNVFDPITCVQEPEEGSLRIILSWGEIPYDLDSHLTGPRADATRFHVYFSHQTDGDISLDVDDTSSYGPETITIPNLYDGMYRYSIHNYSNQTVNGGLQIEQSPTLVEIYDMDGLVADFTAPSFTGNGNTWRVFEINVSGTTTSINPINTYVQASGSSDFDTFKQANDKSKVKFDMIHF